MTNKRIPTYAEALAEARQRLAHTHGNPQQLEERAVVEAVAKAQLTTQQALRAIQGRDPYDDGSRRAATASLADHNRAVNSVTTNLRDLALRMTGRAEAEGKDVAAEIAAARNPKVRKSTEQDLRDATRGMSFGEAVAFLMANGPKASANADVPLNSKHIGVAPAIKKAINDAVDKALARKTPAARTPQAPVSKALPPLDAAKVAALRAMIDDGRELGHVKSPEGLARLAECEVKLNKAVAERGVR